MSQERFSVAHLARLFEMDRRTVALRLDDSDAESGAKNSKTYTVAQVHEAFVEEAVQKASVAQPARTTEEKTAAAELMAAAQLRIVLANAGIAEMKEAKERGTLIEAERVGGLWETMVMAFRQGLLNLPSQGSVLVEGCANRKEIEEVLDQLVRDALEQLSRVDATKKELELEEEFANESPDED